MKYFLLIYLTSFLAFANSVIETKDGTFLNIYANDDRQSNIIANVSIDRGKFNKKRCFKNDANERWCKLTYSLNGLKVNGYVDEKSLDKIVTRPNFKKTFEKNYGGRYDDVGNTILALKDGFLMAGYTESFGKGGKDVYLMKVDRFGNKLWSSVYGGPRTDVANAIVSVRGGFMIAGTTSSFGNRAQSVYLAKINNDGKLTWQNGYYSDEDDYYTGNDLVKISDDNVMVAGSEDHVSFFNSEIDLYINAVYADGKRNGIKRYGGEDMDKANSVISVKDGYIFAGVTDTWGHGSKDAYVVKIDKQGKQVWHNAFGFKKDEVANQIIATKDGGYVIVGTTQSDIYNLKDVYVVKMDKAGTKEWQGHYGSQANEEGFGVVETSDGYVITGYTEDSRNYDSNVYLLKLDKSGSVYWSKKYGGDKDDEGRAIVKVKDGFVVTGYTTSDETSSKDLYILKVDKNGNIN